MIRCERVGSTMDEVARLAALGASEGTAVLAEAQTAGRGRAGRAWLAPPGSAILLSVLLRPPLPSSRLGALPLVIGVAVAEALEATAGVRPRLKWPNDVLLGERKIAGILVMTRTGGDDPFAVVGIGLNVNTGVDVLPPGATSLLVETGRSVSRELVLVALFDRLDAAYRGFVTSEGRPDLRGWRSRAVLLGELVTVAVGEASRAGVFRDVDPDGALVLSGSDGGEERIVMGELSRGPVSAQTREKLAGLKPRAEARNPLRG